MQLFFSLPLCLPFWAGIQFSHNSLTGFNDRRKIWENRWLWTVFHINKHLTNFWHYVGSLSGSGVGYCKEEFCIFTCQNWLAYPFLFNIWIDTISSNHYEILIHRWPEVVCSLQCRWAKIEADCSPIRVFEKLLGWTVFIITVTLLVCNFYL